MQSSRKEQPKSLISAQSQDDGQQKDWIQIGDTGHTKTNRDSLRSKKQLKGYVICPYR